MKPELYWFLQELAALRNVFMLVFINKNEDGILGFIGHPGNYIGHTTAYLFFLLFVQSAGHPDVDVRHCFLLDSILLVN